MSFDRFIVKNLIFVYLFSYLAAPLGYFIRMIYSRALSVEEFGLFYAVIGFYTFISIFNDLGFSETLGYYGTRFYEKKKYAELKASMYFAIFMQSFSSVIITLLVFISSSFLATNYFKSPIAANALII